jgi:hypothetical protein
MWLFTTSNINNHVTKLRLTLWLESFGHAL